MTQEATVSGDERSDTFKRLLPFGHAAMLAVVLFATVVMGALILSLRHDVATLGQQARAAAKAAKAAREELAAIQEVLDAAQASAMAAHADAATPTTEPAAAGPVRVGYSSLRPVAPGGPIPVCVFKGGDPNSLADCIKRGTARKTRS